MRAKHGKRNERHGDYRNLTQRALSQSMLSQLQVSYVFFQKISIELPIFPLKLSCSFFLFLFAQNFSIFSTSYAISFHASFSCSLFLLRSSFPAISFQSYPSPTTHLLHYLNCRHGFRMVTSLLRISCMQLHGSYPLLQKNIFNSSLGDIKYPLVLLIKVIIINTRVGLQKEGYANMPSMVEFTSVRNMNTKVKRKCEQ